MPGFADQVAASVRKFKRRYRATARGAIQKTNSIAQETVFEGGRMRIKTGFLRASNSGAVGQMPRGPVRGEKDGKYAVGSFVGTPVSTALLSWEPLLQVPFYVGWTANYARLREANDGFLREAVGQWGETVRQVGEDARRRIR